jgi:alpha-maltose-1-phosphate synthase
MPKSKVVILRGSSLNSWELQNYSPISKYYDLLGVATKQAKYDTKLVDIPIQKLNALSDWKVKLGKIGKLPVVNRMGDRFVNLHPALKDAKIVHSAETFNVYSHQVAKSKSRYGYKLVLTVWENIPFLWDGVGVNSEKVHQRKREVIAATDRFLAVTERAKSALLIEGVPEEKISVVPMGIDLRRFVPLPKDRNILHKLNLSENDFIIVSVGFLSWYKGMQDLIFAARRLKQLGIVDRHSVRFVIVGDGPDKAEIYGLIKRLQLEDVFRTIEKVEYDEMVKFHNLADIFYLGSWPAKVWQEQFGMVLLESMACGKPIITTDSGSISEVINGAGVLFPSADYHRLTNILQDMIRDKDRRLDLGIRALQRAQEHFNYEVAAERIREVYDLVSQQ